MTYCRPVYTKHFAERFVERCNGDMSLLRKLKCAIQSKYCEHVFDCIVYGNPRRVKCDGYKAVIFFSEEEKKLYVKTIY